MGDRRAPALSPGGYAPGSPPAPGFGTELRRRFRGGRERPAAAAGLLVAAATAWAFWPTLTQLFDKWLHNPQYSHGLLVPLFVGWLLWSRRDRFPAGDRPALLLGGLFLAAGAACRLAGAVLYFEFWFDAFALLVTGVGMVFLFGGRRTARWAAPGLAFLLFMIPLPYRVEIQLGFPLQRLATIVSTYVLQTLGQPALAEGNTILIRDFKLGIVEACSGLRMLVTFITFATAACMVVKKPFSDKLLILLSAVPIALVTNVIRIVVTGLMYLHVSSETAHLFFHDLAGWFMMPLALGFLWAELWVLRRLFVDLPARPALR
jgi:exosortase